MNDRIVRHIGATIVDEPRYLRTAHDSGLKIEFSFQVEDFKPVRARILSLKFLDGNGSMIAGKGDRVTVVGEYGHDGELEYFWANRAVKFVGHLYPSPAAPSLLEQLRHKINSPSKDQ